jgi:hypothetical protein
MGELVCGLKAALIGDGQQEGEENLSAGLRQPQLLKNLVPVPVQALAFVFFLPDVRVGGQSSFTPPLSRRPVLRPSR